MIVVDIEHYDRCHLYFLCSNNMSSCSIKAFTDLFFISMSVESVEIDMELDVILIPCVYNAFHTNLIVLSNRQPFCFGMMSVCLVSNELV